MCQLQKLKDLVTIYGKEVLEGREEDEVEKFILKLYEAVKMFDDCLPTISEDILKSLSFSFDRTKKEIAFKTLTEVEVAFKIFEKHLDQRENEAQSIFGKERSRMIDSLGFYRIKFDQVKRKVEDKVREEKSKVRNEKAVEALLKSYSLIQIKVEIDRYDEFDEKIDLVDSTLKSLHESEFVKEYMPEKVKGLELDLLSLRNELFIQKAINSQRVEQEGNFNTQIEKMHLDVFRVNGYRLFDYLMKNWLTTSQKSDISFYYRMMDKEGFIHAKQKQFKDFLEKEYPNLEQLDKIKLFDDVNSDWRRRTYSMAKSVIGLK